MATCVRCGAPVGSGVRWCEGCLPVAAPDGPPLKVSSTRPFPVPADGTELHVDDFPDALVPFVGDPKRSLGVGQLVQILSAFGAAVMVMRAIPALVVWFMARKPSLTARDVIRMADAWRTFDDMRWASVASVVVVAALVVQFERARRPRGELAARGEAFVEASWVRVSPPARAVAIGVLVAIGLIGAVVPTSPLNSFDAIAWTYLGLSIASVCLAAAAVLVFRSARASRRHLERRLAISAGLTPDDVPFVAPDTKASRRRAEARAVARVAGTAHPGVFPVDEHGDDPEGLPG